MKNKKKFDGNIKIKSKKTPYSGFFRLDRYELIHPKHLGGMSPVLVRELLERGHTAVVLPYDPSCDSVVMVEQFRIGAYAAGADPWLSETIAGIIDDGETAEQVAYREALEEANCKLIDLVEIGRFIMSPGGSSETAVMFCGRVDSRGIGGVYGLVDEGEDILAKVLPLKEALEDLHEGRIISAYAAIPLLWLQLNKASLKKTWK